MSKESEQSAALSVSALAGVFTGRYDHALDPKKRLTIPSGWRAVMGNPKFVYVMPDRKDQCLNLVPEAEMKVMIEKLRQSALFDPARTRVLQLIGAMSEQLDLDCQGRIRISDKLLQFANLTTTVAMLGSVRTVRLWNPDAVPEDKIDQAALDAAMTAAGL